MSETVHVAFNGATVSRVLEGQKTFDLVVWFDEQSRSNLEVMKTVLIDTLCDGKIFVSHLAEARTIRK